MTVGRTIVAPGVSPETERKAVLTVASRCETAEDCRLLLRVLDLDPRVAKTNLPTEGQLGRTGHGR